VRRTPGGGPATGRSTPFSHDRHAPSRQAAVASRPASRTASRIAPRRRRRLLAAKLDARRHLDRNDDVLVDREPQVAILDRAGDEFGEGFAVTVSGFCYHVG